MTLRLGIDTGGTFTDLALIDDRTGRAGLFKLASTPADPSTAIAEGARYLMTVTEEMGVTLVRTAFSPNIKERGDCSTAMFDRDGQTVAQAPRIAIHLGSMLGLVAEVLKQIIRKLTDKTGIAAVTTAGSMIEALRVAKVRQVAVVTPYVKKTNEALADFLERHSIKVAALETFDMLDMFDHARIEPWAIYELARKAARKGGQGIFIACTQLRAVDVLDTLEADLGRPALSATQATMWAALWALGVREPVNGFGSLLRGDPA